MADEKKSEELQQQFYLPPPKLSKWEGFKLFMWNSERREFMGRTASSWGKVGLFYLIFYAGLAAFFAVMLVIFYQTLDVNEPKWQQEKSVIGTNPGLGFRPMPPEQIAESTLIWFKHGETVGNWEFYVKELKRHLEEYEAGRQTSEYFKQCEAGETSGAKSCFFVLEYNNWGACNIENQFGFRDGTPCMLIKMNRIYGWKPVLYGVNETIPDASKELERVRRLHSNDASRNHTSEMVWVTCEGENPADKENIGEIEYYPFAGFPAKYFPYKNVHGYLSPFVFAHFKSLQKNVLINVECKAWAKNIKHARMERRGSVHFELMVD
uniref:Sodium/potassium-transporting ATPase subunit beta-2 n=1 Tax=Scolopendra viridis TaxID=118503 RepID=A0A4D5R9Z6_SCOVI